MTAASSSSPPPSSSLSAFLTSLVVNSVTALVFLLLFTFLKARYVHFFSPLYKQRKREGFHHGGGSLPSGLLSLARYVLRISARDVINHAGIDAYVLSRFMEFGAKLFGCLT